MGGNSALKATNAEDEFGERAKDFDPKVEDPEDYFSRLGQIDNLFRIVSRRYTVKQIHWSAGQISSTARKPASK